MRRGEEREGRRRKMRKGEGMEDLRNGRTGGQMEGEGGEERLRVEEEERGYSAWQ